MLTLIKLLAIPSILAWMVLGCVMYALSLAELDVKASRVIIGQKDYQLAVAAEAIMDKGKLSKPIAGKMKRKRK